MGQGKRRAAPGVADAARHVIPLNDLGRAYHHQAATIDRAVKEVLDSGWYVMGSQHDAFEREFSEAFGLGHVVGVGNGTDALELALLSVNCSPGDEVVTAANAGMYTTAACLKLGVSPRFADVDPRTLLLTASSLHPVITPRTRAVVVTHLYGQLAEMAPIVALCRAAGVAMIEDCAQAVGARSGGQYAGSFGDVACFSFYPTKNLGALGDGGAVATSDAERAQRLKQLRQYGWCERYLATVPGGRNSRLDEIQAAVLRVRLHYLGQANTRRRQLLGRYADALVGRDEYFVHCPGATSPSEDTVAHLAVMRTHRRLEVSQKLLRAGISVGVHYPVPDHKQPVLAHKYLGISLPITEAACEEVLTVPCYPELSEGEIDMICDVFSKL
jgi:dTDP-4-amino-4,6-dideoxygalactose transaminase